MSQHYPLSRSTIGLLVALSPWARVLHAGGSDPAMDGAAGYRVLVNAENPVTEMSRREIALLFLNSQAQWRQGPAGRPVDQSMRAPVREVFSKDVLGKSLGEVRRHWEERMLSNREMPPPAKASDDEVVVHVGKNRGGIGYVSANAVMTSSVKPLRIVD